MASEQNSSESSRGALRRTLCTKQSGCVTWICAFFLLGYVGIKVAIGGWIVTFMTRVRHGADFASGMSTTGFWLGITFGRFVLGFVTPRLGEKLAVIVCYTPPPDLPNSFKTKANRYTAS